MDEERKENSLLDGECEMIAHSAQAAYAVSAAVKAGGTAAVQSGGGRLPYGGVWAESAFERGISGFGAGAGSEPARHAAGGGTGIA